VEVVATVGEAAAATRSAAILIQRNTLF